MRLLMIQHVACEGPGLLEEVLRYKGWELDIRCMDTLGVTLPEALYDYQALIILGGPMGANDEKTFPYLATVQGLIRIAAKEHKPTVGICLGAQLIAKALGADVRPNPVKEIGWCQLQVLAEGAINPMFKAMPNSFAVFQWHGDTFSLPAGAVLLAQADSCKNQAFVWEKHIWAMQFHLEVTTAMIAQWSEFYENELANFAGPGAAKILIRNTEARWKAMQTYREQFLNNIEALLRNNKVDI